MQVFTPLPSLASSILLDDLRLGNQIWREAKTLITDGWRNHPAYKIWAGHKHALAQYCVHGLMELYHRRTYGVYFLSLSAKYSPDQLQNIRIPEDLLPQPPVQIRAVSVTVIARWLDYFHNQRIIHPDNGPPPIIMRPEYCAAHRAALLYKRPEFYSVLGWRETPEINYIWE